MIVRIAQIAVRRRRYVIAAWVAVMVVGLGLGTGLINRLDPLAHGDERREAIKGADALERVTGTSGEIVALVDDVDPAAAATRQVVEAAVADIRALPGVVTAFDYYSTGNPALVANDGRATLIVTYVASALSDRAERDVIEQIEHRYEAIGDNVRIGGILAANEAFRTAAEDDLRRGESIALPIALVVMVLIFGGWRAALLPLSIAIASIASSIVLLLVATTFMDVSVYALNVVSMLGLGLGIDYGLLIVSRFREERAAGRDVPDAVDHALDSAGRTVLFSALTVAASMLGLLVFRIDVFYAFALAGIGVVVFSMLVALTLLPALLASPLGAKIKPALASASDHGYFATIARFVQRRAAPVAALLAVGLVLLAVPFLRAHFEYGDPRDLPRSSEVRNVALTLVDRFPSRGADPVTVVAQVPPQSPAVSAYAARLAALPGVANVAPRPTASAETTVLDVIPVGETQGDNARSVVRAVRAVDTEFDVLVTGTTPFLLDMKDSLGSSLPLALVVIALATFVLLFLMTGSVAVPIKAIVMNLLSLSATFGALVWVFQDGHLSSVLDFESTGAIDLFMPVFIFIFAFGLSMDYEVFLLSRIKEIHDRGADNDTAVATGLQRSGRIITSAALLIVIVFAGFAAGESLNVKQLGFGLAIAVVVDATIVRTFLVPATMRLLGEWNWWAPRPLRRIYERFGLHEAPSAPSVAPVLHSGSTPLQNV
jgi:RND superfamily putative drug exporter